MWHFGDSWRHGVIYQTCFWGDELEILQYYPWKSGNVVFGMPYLCWEQQNCPKLMKILTTILLGILVLEIGGTPNKLMHGGIAPR